MRRLFFAASLALALPLFLLASGGQHAGAAPAAAAPVAHAAPAPMHAALSGTAHAYAAHPSTVHHSITHTGSLGTSSAARLSTHSASTRTPIATPPLRSAWQPGLLPSSVAPPPSSLAYTNSVPLLLPSGAFFGRHTPCFGGLGCYGQQGNHFRFSGVIIPFGFGGFYWPVPYYDSDDNGEGPAPDETQSADQIDNGENGYNPNDTNNGNQQAAAEQVPEAPREYYAAPPDYYQYQSSEPVLEYVFVKRDGTKIFAVAYSLSNNKIQYVTKEGLRRTVPLDALDFDATEKSNQERGNTVNLPSPPPSIPS
jgi:hypothetical protein